MLKRIMNCAEIRFTLTPLDPLLIKSGQANVSGVDMSFVRTRRFAGEEQPFIPGSSLKGVLRTHAERICRSLRDTPVPVCLPYLGPEAAAPAEREQVSCGLRFEKIKDGGRKRGGNGALTTAEMYHYSCPVCRLFGSHVFVGRFRTADACLVEGQKPVFEIRDGVAIDRFTGGVFGAAKYDLEVLVRGDFTTVLDLQNFERWQLGLVALLLRDLTDGVIRIGSGASRGLGRVQARIESFTVSYFGKKPEGLCGLGRQSTPDEIRAYGFFPEEGGDAAPLPESHQRGLRHTVDLSADWKDRLEPAVVDFTRLLAAERYYWPEGLQQCERRLGGHHG